MTITEEDIKQGYPTKEIPGAPEGAVWLGNVYGEDDDWRIYAVPIRTPVAATDVDSGEA